MAWLGTRCSNQSKFFGIPVTRKLHYFNYFIFGINFITLIFQIVIYNALKKASRYYDHIIIFVYL